MKVTSTITQLGVHSTITQKGVGSSIAESGVSHTPPVFVSAEIGNVDNNILVITYDIEIDPFSVPANSDYSVTFSGGAVTITDIQILSDGDGKFYTVEITLSRLINTGETGTFSYTPGDDPIRSRTDEEGIAAALTSEDVTNNVTTITISANSDIVEVGGYPTVISTGGTILVGKAKRFYINKSNTGRIRANSTITQIKVYFGNITGITALYFQVWRYNGSTYTLIYSENILSKASAPAINTITLATPTAVQEGDYVSIGEEAGIATVSNMYQSITSTQTHATKYEDTEVPTNNYAWDSKTSLNYRIPLKIYGNAPMTVCIGDSIVSGNPGSDSLIQDSLVHNKLNSFAGQLEALNALYNPQNMGYPTQTTTQILARFTADCINLKPKIAILEGGVNDINGGVITKATFLSNWTSMLDACETAGIIPVVCKILPWTNGTNTQMQTRDNWMTDLETLVATYSGALFVDFDTDMGEFRAGGDAGNLWDLQSAYDSDGVHLTLAGYTKMAEVINTVVSNKYYLE